MTTVSVPFEELLAGHVVRVTKGSPPLIWAVDLVRAITGKGQDYAGQILRNLRDDLFSREKITTKEMPGKGNGNVPLVTFQHALELLMVLPGRAAKAIRHKAADILTRYFAGDPALARELRANAASDAGLHELARVAAAAAPAAVAAEPLGARLRRIADDRAAMQAEARAAHARVAARRKLSLAEADTAIGVEGHVHKHRRLLAQEDHEHRCRLAMSAVAAEEEVLKRRRQVELEDLESEERIRKRRRELQEEDLAAAEARAERSARLWPPPPPPPPPPAAPGVSGAGDGTPPSAPGPRKGVYVLQLNSGDDYYVGKSHDIDTRILEHKAARRRVLREVPPDTQGSAEDLEEWERTETLHRMRRHGIERVRGWMFTKGALSAHDLQNAFAQICERFDLCRRCGRANHFASACFARAPVAWSPLDLPPPERQHAPPR